MSEGVDAVDPFRLDGRTAFITGATSGIGFAIAARLRAQGARVILSGEDEVGVRAACEKLGADVTGLAADLAQISAPSRLTAGLHQITDRLDILVCNAGITGAPGPQSAMTAETFDRVIGINLRSAALLCSLLLPTMVRARAQGGGSVILTGSIAASRGNGAINAYALAKAGLLQLARNLPVEWGSRGIRVNSVSPGLIDTPLSAPLLANAAFMARRMAMTPLRRLGQAGEVADAAAFLGSGLTDHSQKRTVAASASAEKKTVGQRS